MNLTTDKKALFESLQHFRDQGYSFHEIIDLVSELLVFGETMKFQGNQTKASINLGVSRGAFRKILRAIKADENNIHKPIQIKKGG